ncbi:ATP-binding protein [Methylobacterium segetis]|uniref:sensor histidine kinase n=1 Tax=Methylobacterium segetis TaxID=2488750 RepID=UPI001FE213A2|nr:cache domain-containing protein [Methylobacterium segetis]
MKRESSPGNRLLISLALAAAIPILLFSGWVAYVTAEQGRAAARHAALESTARVADRVSADLAAQVQILDVLAASPALDSPSLEPFHEEAQRLKASRPLWETVELADASGNQIVNLLRPLGTVLGPTADRDSFDEVLRLRRAVVGGIGPVGTLSGKRLVALRVPVIRDGQLRYVLTVALATNAVSSILRDAGAPAGWVGEIVDRRGNIIARTSAEASELGRPASPALRAAIARAPEGFYSGPTLEGSDVETVYRTLPDTSGWSVHFGVPSKALNAPVSRSFYVLVAGGLASLALAAGLAALTARDIAQRRRDEETRMMLALRVSEERGALAVEAAELGTVCWDLARQEVAGSERTRVLLGFPRAPTEAGEAQWSFAAFLAAVHTDDRERVEQALRRCVTEDAQLDSEFRSVRPDGGARWLRTTGRAPCFHHGDRPSVIYGVIADAEPRKRAEAERTDLLRRLSDAQENEQRRIARELHDQVGQTVTGLSLGLKSLETRLGNGACEPDTVNQVRWLQALAAEIGRDIHRAALDLRPTALDDLGLHKALAAYAEEWRQRHGIDLDLQVLGSETRLPADVETAAYRIVQEALTNILKHARARGVSLVLDRRADGLRVIVEDDGAGFDSDAANGHTIHGSAAHGKIGRRLGLSGIRERLALLGGTLAIESAPGSGTTLFAEIPLPPEGAEP